MVNSRDREITYEIVEHIGVIASYSTGWKKELNMVKWNDGAPKYDIREWDPGHEHMSRGITLHEKEMQTIIDLVTDMKRHAACEPGSCSCGMCSSGEEAQQPLQ